MQMGHCSCFLPTAVFSPFSGELLPGGGGSSELMGTELSQLLCAALSVSQRAPALLGAAHRGLPLLLLSYLSIHKCLKPTPGSFMYFVELCLLFSVSWEEGMDNGTSEKGDGLTIAELCLQLQICKIGSSFHIYTAYPESCCLGGFLFVFRTFHLELNPLSEHDIS